MISLAALKMAMKVGHDAEDDYVTALESAAVEFVQNETGRYFGAPLSTTEYLTGAGRSELYLAEAPATLPATLSERPYPGSDPVTITAASTDGYVLRGAMTLVRKAGLLWARGYEYQVTYTKGYAPEAEPTDIRQLVTALVTHWYVTRVPVAETGGSGDPLPLHAQKILARWRRRPW